MRIFLAALALMSIGDSLKGVVFGSPTISTSGKVRTPRGLSKRRVPTTHVLHERHLSGNLEGWVKRGLADAKSLLPMRIGLKQSNLDEGHDLLMDM